MASVVALIQNSNLKILFLQRSARSSRPLQWCLPGGKIKSGETPAAALIREVKEEAGLDIHVVGQLVDFGDQSYWHCELTSATAVALNERESSAFVWCHPHRILGLGFVMDLNRLRQVLEIRNIELGECS